MRIQIQRPLCGLQVRSALTPPDHILSVNYAWLLQATPPKFSKLILACSLSATNQEVGRAIVLGVWWSVTDVLVRILMLSRLCCVSGNVCGLLVAIKF